MDKLEEEEDQTDIEVLMDSQHDSGISIREFWRQLWLHILWPVSLAWYPKKIWPQGAINQKLISRKPIDILFHSTNLLCFFHVRIVSNLKK